MSHWIGAHVIPFLIIALASTKLAVPMITLPYSAALFPHVSSRKRFPKTHPSLERRRVEAVGRTKNMHVIGHDHVPSHHPCLCNAPCADNCFVRFGCRQNWPSFRGARCHENDTRTIVCFQR